MSRPFKMHFGDADTNKRCGLCERPLKANLLLKKPNAKLCYKCFKITVLDQRSGHHGMGRGEKRAKQEPTHEHHNKYENKRSQ